MPRGPALFAPLPVEVHRLLAGVPALIEKTFPMPGRFRPGLPRDVAELSRLLTAERGERALSYLSRPNLLSAYLRYFLPWNIYRLCRLLPFLDISLSPGDAIVDIGCGPLTLAAALWISRPELRGLPLELRCVDRTGLVLDAGKKFFAALSGIAPEGAAPSDVATPDAGACPWKIVTIKGNAFGKNVIKGKPAVLVCAVNVFNEIYGDIPHSGSLGQAALHSARQLDSLCAETASILVVEPGVPRWGEFITCLRDALIEKGRFPLSPCPHNEACPFPGGSSKAGKKRWCHFAFDTEDAPPALHKLSAAAGIPKERAVLSFLFAGPRVRPLPAARAGLHGKPGPEKNPQALPESFPKCAFRTRIVSDAFPLSQGQFGRYGCSDQGLVLVTGKKPEIEKLSSGALIKAVPAKPPQRDPKSGALLVTGVRL
jgi:hypothetical protein